MEKAEVNFFTKRNAMITGIGGLVTIFIGVYNFAGDNVPASRSYVQDYVKEQLVASDTRIIKMDQRLSETQFQMNSERRGRLMKEQFDLDVKLKDPATALELRTMIQQRKNAVDDELEDANRERNSLRTRGTTGG